MDDRRGGIGEAGERICQMVDEFGFYSVRWKPFEGLSRERIYLLCSFLHLPYENGSQKEKERKQDSEEAIVEIQKRVRSLTSVVLLEMGEKMLLGSVLHRALTVLMDGLAVKRKEGELPK